MKYPVFVLLLCGLLSMPVAAAYNQPFQVEVHAGPAIPSDDIREIDLDTGFALGASVSYHFLNRLLGVYFDYDVSVFNNDSLDTPLVETVLLSGLGLGMEHQGDFGASRLGYYVRAGVHFSELSLLDDDGDDIDDTRTEIGLQTSAGVKYSLGESWALRGGLLIKTFAEPLRRNPANGDAELNMVVLNFGATFRF